MDPLQIESMTLNSKLKDLTYFPKPVGRLSIALFYFYIFCILFFIVFIAIHRFERLQDTSDVAQDIPIPVVLIFSTILMIQYLYHSLMVFFILICSLDRSLWAGLGQMTLFFPELGQLLSPNRAQQPLHLSHCKMQNIRQANFIMIKLC
jgi:hypothetical protein